jgi:ribonuclease BN (tRNA processing enzyme)
VELIVLGAGPAYTDRPGASGASYLLLADDASLLLDVGHGSFANLARAIEPSQVSGIAVSHLHPDHFIDLVALVHYLRYQVHPPGRVRVHAPRALPERLDALLGEPGFTAAALDHVPLAASTAAIGPFELEARRIRHTDDSFAFRVRAGGAAIVYSGDCGNADDLAPLIRPGDVLLSEVSFGPGPVPAGAEHLDAKLVGALATRTRAGRLLLTHLQMGFSPAETLAVVRQRFAGPSGFVAPGDRHSL